jgi:hypothetical protein
MDVDPCIGFINCYLQIFRPEGLKEFPEFLLLAPVDLYAAPVEEDEEGVDAGGAEVRQEEDGLGAGPHLQAAQQALHQRAHAQHALNSRKKLASNPATFHQL